MLLFTLPTESAANMCVDLFKGPSRFPKNVFDDKARSETRSEREVWESFQFPIQVARPTGLKKIREAAAKSGYFVVIPEAPPERVDVAQFHKKLYGNPVYAGGRDLDGKLVRRKGVAFHPGYPTTRFIGNIQGEINVHLGWERLYKDFTNKITEAAYALKHDAQSMTPFLAGDKVIPKSKEKEFEALRAEAKTVLLRLMNAPSVRMKPEEFEAFSKLITFYLNTVEAHFPRKAFIKHVAESMGAEGGGMIQTLNRKDSEWTAQFRSDLNKIREKLPRPVKREITLSRADRKITAYDDATNATRILQALIFDPGALIVQEAANVARTPLGHLMEFRVNFVDGEPVSALGRHSWEYMPVEERIAMDFIAQLFSKLPAEAKYFSGGADVVIEINGKPRIIEFNFGGQAGDFDPWWAPVFGNMYMSAVIGKKTPIIRELDDVFASGLEGQKKFMESLDRDGSVYRSSVEEVYSYFMRKNLEEWSENREHGSGVRVLQELKELKSLIDRLGTQGREAFSERREDIDQIYRAAEDYVRRLSKR